MQSIVIPRSSKIQVKQRDALRKRLQFSGSIQESGHSNLRNETNVDSHHKSTHSPDESRISTKCSEDTRKLALKSFSNNDTKFGHTSFERSKINSFLNLKDARSTIDFNEGESETSMLCEPILDYSLNDDGSVTCKICRETVPSRTHWYRHKYKVFH